MRATILTKRREEKKRKGKGEGRGGGRREGGEEEGRRVWGGGMCRPVSGTGKLECINIS